MNYEGISNVFEITQFMFVLARQETQKTLVGSLSTHMPKFYEIKYDFSLKESLWL